MDPDRVRSYLQVACAGLGFDIGEVWWMSNESGTSTVAEIEERNSSSSTGAGIGGAGRGSGGGSGHDSDSSGEDTYATLMNPKPGGVVNGGAAGSVGGSAASNGSKKNRGPKKRFLQLYTSKAYCNQRSKLVQPHENDGREAREESKFNGSNTDAPSSSGQSSGEATNSNSLVIRRDNSMLDEDEHVLSPRIVEAVTCSAQVVWANCQKQEGLLGRSDIKLQTAIGMPVGVDESGNVWVVVMFSPKNVESSSDAIDYLQYISKSAASCSIPCLLPVIHHHAGMAGASSSGKGGPKLLTQGVKTEEVEEEEDDEKNGQHQQQFHSSSLVSIQPKVKPVDHTQELGEGVIAQFVSFRLSDDDENDTSLSAGMDTGSAFDIPMTSPGVEINDLRNAPKDDFGIPMLPDMQQNNNPTMAISDTITDAFDEASYGVWSTIMNSAGGDTIRTSGAIASKMHVIQERLEEFAMAFLGMSVFDVADAWITSISSVENGNATDIGDGIVVCNAPPKLKCLFTVAPEDMKNDNVHVFREVSASASIDIGDGAVGKAFSTGYPVWSSDKNLIYDKRRKNSLQNCKIATIFAVPIFSAGDVSPSCVLSCYSLLPAQSVPFVLNFVQKAVRLLWDGLDKVKPHASVGNEMWKDVGPADLGEMAADMEMQRAFLGKKRTYSMSSPGQPATVDNKHVRQNPTAQTGLTYLLPDDDEPESPTGRDRSSSYATQINVLPSLAPSPLYSPAPVIAPPAKGLPPAPMFPTTVQRAPMAQQFVQLNPENDGYWAVQQAVRSVGNVSEWHSNSGASSSNPVTVVAQHHPQQQPNSQATPIQPAQPQYQPEYQYQMDANGNYFLSYANYGGNTAPTTWIEPTQQEVTPPPQSLNPPPPQALSQPPGAPYQPPNNIQTYEPNNTYTEDPNTVQANIMEFNAMAQMHSDPNAIYHNTQPIAVYDTQMQNSTTVPVMAQHPQQNMFCTPTVQPVVSIDPSIMVSSNSNGKVCRIEGCIELAVAKRPYCFRHCGNRQCEREGCTKCAQGATRFCIAHGGGRRCTFPGCDKGARDKFFCAAHGGGKRCKLEGCSKSAVGGSSFCTSHGGGRRCQVEGCDKSAQSSTSFCVKHGGGKKCQHQGCEKVARGRTLFCAAHGGGVRCKLEGCNRVAIGKAQLCRAHGGGSNRLKAVAMQPMQPPLHNMMM